MIHSTRRFSMCAGVCCLLWMAPLQAADWPGWRGSQRDAEISGFQTPKAWPETLTKRWSLEVGSGHASPIVAGNKVYQFARVGEKEITRCLDLATGKELWSAGYSAPYKMHSAARGHGQGPKSTPLVSGGKLYTLGISGILTARDAGSGKQLWQHEYSKRFPKTSPLYGTSMSPLLVQPGRLIAHVGGHDQGALSAFDAAGKTIWQWAEDGPGYTSPVVATLGGTRQIVTQSQNFCLGISPEQGTVLWKIPYKTAYDQNIVTPVIYQNLLIFSGYDKGTTAYRLVKQGSWFRPEAVWTNRDVSMYMSSPVLSGKLLCGFSHKKKGQYFCLDASSGKTLWTSQGRQGENAVLVSGGNVWMALNTGGELIVFRQSAKQYEELRRYRVSESATWAHPAFVGRRLLIKIKNTDTLTLWEIGG